MSAPKHTKPRTPRPKAWAIVLTVLAILLLLVAGAMLYFWSSLNRSADQVFARQTTVVPTIPPAAEATPSRYDDIEADWIASDGTAYNYREGVINMLFIGVDYLNDERRAQYGKLVNGGNSDVLILASLDTLNNTLSILEIPRDTMTDIIRLDEDNNFIDTIYTNISAAHSYSMDQEIACELTTDAVSRLLCGIPIHSYVALSYYAIKPINQLLGGVELTFDQDYTDLDPAFTEGATVTLTDDQFYAFVHDRDLYSLNSAYNRGARHIFLLNSLYDVCKAEFEADITFPIRMYNGVKEHVTTNLDLTQISYLAALVFEADFHASDVERIPGELTLGETYAEYFTDSDWIESYVAETLSVPVS